MAECLGEPDFSSPRVWTHRSEFPAEYSLAGCSPAEPASASSAALILNLATPVRHRFSANCSCPLNRLSQDLTHSTNQRRPGVDCPLPFRRATSWRCNNLHLGRDPAESLFPRLQPPSGKPVTHQLNEWIGPVSSQQWSSSVEDCPEVSRRNCERKMHIAPAGRGVKSFYRTCPRPLHYQYTRGVTIIR